MEIIKDISRIKKILFIFIVINGCSTSTEPQPNINESLSTVVGIVTGDGLLVPPYSYSDAIIELYQNDSLVSGATSTSKGEFKLTNIPYGNYRLEVRKSLPFGNIVSTSSQISIESDTVNLDAVALDSIKDDYFPLSVGNKWKFDGKSSETVELGIGDRTTYYFTRIIEIVGKEEKDGSVIFEILGKDSSFLKIEDNVFNSEQKADTSFMSEVTEFSDSFIESNGFITSGISINGFHVFVVADDLLYQYLGNCEISEGDLFYIAGAEIHTLLVNKFDEIYTFFTPNIGMVKYRNMYIGNAVSKEFVLTLIEYSLGNN